MAQVPSEQPEPSQTDNAQSKGFDTSWLLWILGFFFIVYPLSIGPAVKLHRACPQARLAIEGFYAPVVALSDKNLKLKAALLWYVNTIWHAN